MTNPLRLATIISAVLAIVPPVHGHASPSDVPAYIVAAVADPVRPADQRSRDAFRKPGEVIAFSGMKPGDRVADFMSAGGYFTRLFSRVVGPAGRVYAFTPDEEIRNCLVEETSATFELARDHAYANIVEEVGLIDDFTVPEKLDVIWTAQNYHDLHDPFLGPADIARVNRNFFYALKSGGVLLIIDHVAQAGSGLRDTDTLHRIDPETIVAEVEAAGFVLQARSDLLRNPGDAHTLRVFDPAIRGRTDQITLKFRKP